MKRAAFDLRSSISRGRPRAVVLTNDQRVALAKIYLSTNRTECEGSMEMAWVLFTEKEIGAEHAWTVVNRRVATRLCVDALETMRRARPLVGAKRGGSKRLRSEGPYVAGSMRIHWSENRRLYAGEQFSVDDLTRNVPTWIHWPWGGCKCSDKFAVKLGRWQTLAVHDDASGTLVAVKSVFRFEQSYRATDAASLVFQTEREVGMAGFGDMSSRWVVEGGVWQSEQMLATLAGRYVSAKGRPNQKLIERWFGAMQTRDSVHLGDVGRRRGEKLEENALYLACRAGTKDPRDHFLCMETGQDALMETFEWMNTREVRSRIYGNWVPQERWEADIANRPLSYRNPADSWVMSPERRRLTVSRGGSVACQAVGPLGVSMPLHFSAPWLWEHLGRQVDLYFDPLGEWPIDATVACPKTRKMLGTVRCQATFGQSRDADVEMATAIRKTMMSELRCIVGTKKRIVEGRGVGGSMRIEINSQRSGIDQAAGSGERGVAPAPDHEPRTSNSGAEIFSAAGRLAVDRASGGVPVPPASGGRTSAEGLRSLSRKAAAARNQVPNW
ncbi:MAG: hypothetical protein ABIS50_15335 [Luteolibacter sp.]|uniref:hypothetical protein n=1 Tax=Luteolibacter sp. TaxID=1962973 RepID=UPI003263E3C7